MTSSYMRQPERKRYCDIKATTLNEVLATCERHIRNCGAMLADCTDCQDCSDDYVWLVQQMAHAWADLRDDVEAIMAAGAARSRRLEGRK